MTWRQRLSTRSRHEHTLWTMVAAILLGGFVLGVVLDLAFSQSARESSQPGIVAPADDNPVPSAGGARWEAVTQAAARGAWGEVWRGVWREMPRTWTQWGPTGLGIATGVCWLTFLLQAGQAGGLGSGRWGPAAAGFVLGVASIGVTLFLIFWQEYGWGLRASGELVAGLRYNVLGVGLREESAKLLCGAALLPVLVWRRDELGALLAFSCVGLGFAAEENIGYIAQTGGAATLGRLLIPAPFHIAMTGLVGLYAYRACRWPGDWGWHFAGAFVLIAALHGLYDALLSLPIFGEYQIAAYILFIGVMREYFRELRDLRSVQNDVVSLTATFLACVSLTAALTFAYLAAVADWKTAADILVSSILAEAVMVYLFLREMPESLVRS